MRDTKKIEILFYLQGALKGIGRTIGATANTLSLNQLSKIEAFKEFVYGDQDVETYMRASMEISLFLALGVITGGLHALNEDDDEESRSIILQNLELAAGRIQKDLGFLLPYVNVPFMPKGATKSGFFSFTDNLARIYSDPFTMGRTSSAYTKVLAQLWEDPTEVYERDGYGYQKGDNKLYVGLQKTAVAPLFQITKMMNPEEQLNFMNVLYKNSSTGTEKEEK